MTVDAVLGSSSPGAPAVQAPEKSADKVAPVRDDSQQQEEQAAASRAAREDATRAALESPAPSYDSKGATPPAGRPNEAAASKQVAEVA